MTGNLLTPDRVARQLGISLGTLAAVVRGRPELHPTLQAGSVTLFDRATVAELMKLKETGHLRSYKPRRRPPEVTG